MTSYLEKVRQSSELSRRSFLKASAAATAALAVSGGLAGCSPNKVEPVEEAEAVARDIVTGEWKTAACWHNCGGRCLNKVLVKDGIVVRQKTDDTHEDTLEHPQIRGCLRGRSQRQQVFGADRIKYPLKRKHWEPGGGQKELRGCDEWERISWDEALDYVAAELKKAYENYGPTGVYYVGWPLGYGLRIAAALGGAVRCVNSSSYGTFNFYYRSIGLPYVGVGPGTYWCESANDRLDLVNSDTIVFYGCNPAWASAGNHCSYFWRAKEAGTDFVYVGPSYNPSASLFEAKWIRVRPGTDVAFLLSVAYTMIAEDEQKELIDWDFLSKYTVGFTSDTMPADATTDENFHDYVLGNYDGVPKTPEWATTICGTPVEDIIWFAETIGKKNKVAILHSFAAARNKGAEDFPQMLMTIGAMGGHMGKSGHSCGSAFHSTAGAGGPSLVTVGGSGLDIAFGELNYQVPDPERWKAVLDGKFVDIGAGIDFAPFPEAVEREVDIHVIMVDDVSNFLQSSLDIMAGIKAFRKVDFAYCQAYTLTTSAKYCDIILPACTQWEKTSAFCYLNLSSREYQIYPSQITEPLFESRTDYDIACGIAERMGLDPKQVIPLDDKQQYFNAIATSVTTEDDGITSSKLATITQDDIDEWGVEGEPQEGKIGIGELMEKGIYQVERAENDKHYYIAYKDFIDDPENNPRPSASGKFEIYSQSKLANIVAASRGNTDAKPYPTYRVPVQGYETTFSDWDNQVKGDLPYLFFTPHYLRRAHTTLNNVPWLREAFENPVFINSSDAAEKGIETGDTVLIWNDFGKVLRRASVLETIMPGVIALPHGSWVDVDEETGIDHGGAENVLSGGISSDSFVSGYNNYNVNFEKYDGDPLEPDALWPQRIIDAE